MRKFVVFWDITQFIVIIPYRRFGTTSPSHLQGSRNPRRKRGLFWNIFSFEDRTDRLSGKVGKKLPL